MKNNKKTIIKEKNQKIIIQLQAIILISIALFLLISLITHDPKDNDNNSKQYVIHNWGGKLGAFISNNLIKSFGKAAFILPFFLPAFAFPYFKNGDPKFSIKQSAPLFLLFFSFLILLSINNGKSEKYAGSLGKAIASPLVNTFGTFGSYLIGILLLVIFIILFFKPQFSRLNNKKEKSRTKDSFFSKSKKNTIKSIKENRVLIDETPGKTIDEIPKKNTIIFKSNIPKKELLDRFKEKAIESNTPTPLITRVVFENDQNDALLTDLESDPIIEEYSDYTDNVDNLDIVEQNIITDYYYEKEDNIIENVIETIEEEPIKQKPKKKNKYCMPDSSLLDKSNNQMDDETKQIMKYNADMLENTFIEFGIEAKVTNICRGPVITRFEISVPPGIKLNRIVALQDNIALNLAAASIRIEAPIPGKSAIGVEVPNKKRSLVTIGDILESKNFKNSKSKIPIALGQTVSGKPMVTDLATMPHLIIAGTTGSGKSVCVNTIICSILYNMKPEKVRLILVDPKYVELAPYNGIPHLLTPVINKPRSAVLALKWCVKEMEERYVKLQELNARNIESYNEKISNEKKFLVAAAAKAHETMPYLVVVIDELADLMILAAKEIEDSISRLAAMSRAVGIHLIFATQRPSVDVITGVIKNNFPSRIAFQVASTTDSRTILDSKGADKLLGKGDSLFIGPGSPFPQRIQGAFLSEEEVDKTAEYLRSLGEPEYNMQILEEQNEINSDSDNSSNDEPLFQDAVDIIINSQRASASYLQRRLKIGYNRAARIIEMMESEGIIGPQQGSKPRDILISSWNK